MKALERTFTPMQEFLLHRFGNLLEVRRIVVKSPENEDEFQIFNGIRIKKDDLRRGLNNMIIGAYKDLKEVGMGQEVDLLLGTMEDNHQEHGLEPT